MSALTAVSELVSPVGRAVGLTLLSGAVATVLGLLYKSYARERMPEGLAVLVGLGTVGLWLNTATALQQFLGGGEALPSHATAVTNVAAFVFGAVAGVAGARVGDRLATDAVALTGAAELDGDVSRLVRTVGRFTTVELPGEIDDMEGYEPVAPETKESLAGKTLRFPRRLTVAELRDRLATRLRDDYGVGHVDADIGDDGAVEFLALGGRVAGIGPTLPSGTVAVAVRADPAFSAGAGDLVQVWTREPDPERVATAELRAAVGDVATLAVGADDATNLDPDAEYRLVTLPTEPRADREFSAQLRAADETVGVVEIAGGSALDGATAGGLDVSVVAVRTDAGVETLPAPDRVFAPGDTLYVIARPDRLRKVESAATETAESAAPDVR
ncbi:cation:proton antiporter regulatory subunit [Halorussus amylolyticus]|uniref:cation:proton antiporter regulatory subunit n=1 Tax=Halorussus amylolyticus TaxID=1126242 RepID=UPI00104E7224|nr:TrkA C-terminal domain-containing protein [Halorussus amylolyticus]